MQSFCLLISLTYVFFRGSRGQFSHSTYDPTERCFHSPPASTFLPHFIPTSGTGPWAHWEEVAAWHADDSRRSQPPSRVEASATCRFPRPHSGLWSRPSAHRRCCRQEWRSSCFPTQESCQPREECGRQPHEEPFSARRLPRGGQLCGAEPERGGQRSESVFATVSRNERRPKRRSGEAVGGV